MASEINIEELKKLNKCRMEETSRIELEKSADLIENFKKYAASKGIVLDTNSFCYIETIGIVATSPGIARNLLEIVTKDKDGLFDYEEIAMRFPPSEFQGGYFVGHEYMIMAHSCYRRGMNPIGNWAPRFIDLFWRLDSIDVKKYIAIDEDRVRINVDGSIYMESDTWYGPPFDEDVSKIKLGTTKLRPPLDLDPMYIDFLFSNAYCIDISWSEQGHIKSFQAVEFKTRDIKLVIDNQIFHPARYLHAEFDLKVGAFRHFDGAVQLFSEEEYLLRRDSDFNMVFKDFRHIKARSIKVFKLNGFISTKLWVELCCQFFAANPLSFEYFNGTYPESIANIIAKIQARRI